MNCSLGRRRLPQATREHYIKYLFLLPALVALVILLAFPILSSFTYSLTNKSLIYPKTSFIGLENFLSILHDEAFWNSALNSFLFTVGIVSLQFLFGLVAALALNRIKRFQGVFRTLLIIPWTFPNIVMTFTWTWLLNDLYGPVNGYLLNWNLITQPILFLGTQGMTIMSVILIMTWFGAPFMMVNVLAGLQSISRSEYEAAKIDGANNFLVFWYVTLPHLKTLIGLILCLRFIWVFNNFDFIFLFTGGGPGTATETLPLYAYRLGWKLNDLGMSAAVAVILFIVLMVATSIYFRMLGKKEKISDHEAL